MRKGLPLPLTSIGFSSCRSSHGFTFLPAETTRWTSTGDSLGQHIHLLAGLFIILGKKAAGSQSRPPSDFSPERVTRQNARYSFDLPFAFPCLLWPLALPLPFLSFFSSAFGASIAGAGSWAGGVTDGAGAGAGSGAGAGGGAWANTLVNAKRTAPAVNVDRVLIMSILPWLGLSARGDACPAPSRFLLSKLDATNRPGFYHTLQEIA